MLGGSGRYYEIYFSDNEPVKKVQILNGVVEKVTITYDAIKNPGYN